jgi:hypothetical protein
MMLKGILAVALSLVVFHEDREASAEKTAQLNAIAAAVAEFTKTPDEAAFLLAWGQAETNYSLRIQRGQCRRWECDRGRARGPWQAHRNGMPLERWERMVGVENTRVQAEQAARHARWALRQCKDDPIRGAFRVLGGNACWKPLKGEEYRVAAFTLARRRL